MGRTYLGLVGLPGMNGGFGGCSTQEVTLKEPLWADPIECVGDPITPLAGAHKMVISRLVVDGISVEINFDTVPVVLPDTLPSPL